MDFIKDQIIDTWLINHRTNLLLLNSITNEALDLTTSKRGGGTIGHQLAHMYNVRFWKLERFNKNLVSELHTIKASDKKSITMLIDCHSESAALISEMLTEGF
ncbi:hypothetical protein [Gramella sp. MAR_2010_147]|uniref:hypothetical protein n=1 Tax=Gramella sp. MAR_2010_147 TaxID=1250205 RepID=UPI000879ADE5|nr:hypothetical protein [Gramella sp. MAR_2010_147]SDS29123.1 hypothetical protein SAMN04488553_1918 [Gramella sp. MAR_2010_147]